MTPESLLVAACVATFIAFLVAGYLAFKSFPPPPPRPRHPQTWEYHVEHRHLGKEELDHLGREGWELISISGDHLHGQTTCTFKRPLHGHKPPPPPPRD